MVALLDEDGRPFAQDMSAVANELNPVFDRDDTSVSKIREHGITAVR